MHLGDKVRFVNEAGDGIITSIQINGMIGVTIEDDFEIMVNRNEIVIVESAIGKNIEANSSKTENNNHVDFNLAKGIYWNFKKTNNDQVIQIFNHTEHALISAVYLIQNNHIELIQSGVIAAQNFMHIYRIGNDKNAINFQLHAQCIWLRNRPAIVPSMFEHKIKISEISQSDVTRKQNETMYFFSPLIQKNEEPKKETIGEQKPIFYTESKPISIPQKPDEVIDLHAEKLELLSFPTHLILQKQMDFFHKQLELALAYNMPKIVFIHGAGTGVLKNLIYLHLKGNKKVKRYHLADENRYGGGAVEIHL